MPGNFHVQSCNTDMFDLYTVVQSCNTIMLYKYNEPPGGLVDDTRDSCARVPGFISRRRLSTACTPVSYTHLDVYKRQV